jgi:hypothetical protein
MSQHVNDRDALKRCRFAASIRLLDCRAVVSIGSRGGSYGV